MTEVSAFKAIQGLCVSGAAAARWGRATLSSMTVVGKRHCFHMETFFNGYEALTLGTYRGLVPTQVGCPNGVSLSNVRGTVARRQESIVSTVVTTEVPP